MFQTVKLLILVIYLKVSLTTTCRCWWYWCFETCVVFFCFTFINGRIFNWDFFLYFLFICGISYLFFLFLLYFFVIYLLFVSATCIQAHIHFILYSVSHSVSHFFNLSHSFVQSFVQIVCFWSFGRSCHFLSCFSLLLVEL